MTTESGLETVTLERDGHVLLIGLNRPGKRNAFNLAVLSCHANDLRTCVRPPVFAGSLP